MMDESSHEPGLYLAKMGSVYDVLPDTTASTVKTRPSTSCGLSRKFEKTEGAISRKPYDTFYTVNMSKDQP